MNIKRYLFFAGLFWLVFSGSLFAVESDPVELPGSGHIMQVHQDTIWGYWGNCIGFPLNCLSTIPVGLPSVYTEWEVGIYRTCFNPLTDNFTNKIVPLEFSIFGIPDDAVIEYVTLGLNTDSTYSNHLAPPFHIKAYDMLDARPSTGLSVTVYTDAVSGNTYFTSSTINTGVYSFHLNAQATTDMQNQLTQDWFAVGINLDETVIGSTDTTYLTLNNTASEHFLIVGYMIPVEVTIQNSFSGGQVIVDWDYKDSPFDTVWHPEELHTIAVDSIQTLPSYVRYLFRGWSDEGSRIHQIQPESDTVFTAYYDSLFRLLVMSDYGIAYGSGWYLPLTSRLFWVTPETVYVGGVRHAFQGWIGTGSGSYTGPSDSAMVTMNEPLIERAQWDTSYFLALDDSGCGAGEPYQTGAGWYAPDTWANIATSDSVYDTLSGEWFFFHHWTGGVFADSMNRSTQVYVDGPLQAIAVYHPPVRLWVFPPDTTDGTPMSVVQIPVIFEATVPFPIDSFGFSIYFDNSILSFVSVTEALIDWDTLEAFDLSSGPAGQVIAGGGSILPETVYSPDTLFYFNFSVRLGVSGECLLQFGDFLGDLAGAITYDGIFRVETALHNVMIRTSFGGGQVYVDGTSFPSPYIDTWTSGEFHEIGADSLYEPALGVRLKFDSWSDSGELVHDAAVISDSIFTALYDTILGLLVESSYGVAYGSGWYEKGSAVPFWVEPETISVSDSTQLIFTGWDGLGLGAYTGPDNPANCVMGSPIQETAEWQSEHYIGLDFLGCGTAIPLQAGEGWYEQDTWAAISTPDSVSDGVRWYYFQWWLGGTFTDRYASSTNILVNAPHTATAVYSGEPGYFRVSPPDTVVGTPGGLILIPAIFSASGPMEMDTVLFDFNYDANIITFLRMQESAVDWDTVLGFDNSVGDSGLVTVIAGNSYGSFLLFPPETLFYFVFRVNPGVSRQSILHFDNFLFDLAGATTADGVLIIRGRVEAVVDVNFEGGSVWVDGTSYSTPYYASWLLNSEHLLEADSLQHGLPGVRMVYRNWSDGGNRAHLVTVNTDTSFIAYYHPQFMLTVESPFGTTEGSGWFEEGDTANFRVFPETLSFPLAEHYFVGWEGFGDSSYSGPDNPAWCLMYSPVRERARWTHNYYLQLAYSGCGLAIPAQTGEGWYMEGTWAGITTDSIVYDGADTFYFLYWGGATFAEPYEHSTMAYVDAPGLVATAYYGTSPAFIAVGPPDTTYGASGEYVLLPVILHTGEPVEMDTIALNVLFSANIIDYLIAIRASVDWDVLLGTDLSSGPAGKVNVFAASAAPNTLMDKDTLFNLVFFVNGDSGETGVRPDSLKFDLNAALPIRGIFIIGEVVNVLITTSFGDGEVIVDGIRYGAPHLETWAVGSEHLIRADLFQPYNPDTQYVFRNWSDGGAMGHYVTVLSDTLFVANYGYQFRLTVDNGGHGTTYGDGWYNEGLRVPFRVEPETVTVGGIRYIFMRWQGNGTGSYSGPNNPASCVMNAAITELALWNTQYYLSLNYSGCGAGIPYQEGEGWYNELAWAPVLSDEIVYDGDNRYHFNYWTGTLFADSSNWETAALVDSVRTATAFYSAFEVSPPDSLFALPGEIVRIPIFLYNNEIMYIDTVCFDFYFNNNLLSFLGMVPGDIPFDSIYGIDNSAGPFGNIETGAFSGLEHEVDPPVIVFFLLFRVRPGTGFSRLELDNLSCDLTGAYTRQGWLVVTSPVEVTITSEAGGMVYMDGVGYPSPLDTLWAIGSPHLIAVDPVVPVADDSIRMVFVRWSDAGALEHTASAIGDTQFTAFYVLQYHLWVASPLGSTSGAGWYFAGDSAYISIDPDSIMIGDSIMYIFDDWIGTGDISYTGPDNPAMVIVNSPIVEVANWEHWYYLTVDNGGHATANGEGWYPAGALAYFSVDPETVMVDATHRVTFSAWDGFGPGAYSGSDNPASVIMNNPVREVASWLDQYYLTILNGGYGTVTGEGWYTYGDSALFYITPTVFDVDRDIRYLFDGWAGTGEWAYSGPESLAYAHIMEPCEEEAQWTLQYYLTVNSPHGIPYGQGWYNAGSEANFGVDPDTFDVGPGSRFQFALWNGTGSGSYTGPENPSGCIMNGPITEDAAWDHQFYLTLNYSGCGGATPIQNGEGWHPAFNWTPISTEDIVYSGAVRYHFDHWEVDSGGVIMDDTLILTQTFMDTAHTATARYSAFEVSPPDTTYVLANDTVDIPIILYNNLSLDILSVGLNLDYPHHILTFLGIEGLREGIPWTTIIGTPMDSNTIQIYATQSGTTVDPPETLFFAKFYAHAGLAGIGELNCYNLIYSLAGADSRPGTVIVQGSVTITVQLDFAAPGAQVRVDGVWHDSPYTATWLSASLHEISAPPYFNIDPETRRRWDNWSDGGTITHNIAPVVNDTFTASYQLQYYLFVNSARGTVSGQGWYDAGNPANFGVTPDSIEAGGTRYIFQSWTGTGSGSYSGSNNPATVNMNNSITEVANWQTQYYLTILNGGRGSVIGSGWFLAGSHPEFEVTPTIIDSTATIRYIFKQWTGIGPGSYTGSTNPGSCTMNGPVTETVVWTRQYYLTVDNGGRSTPAGEGWYDQGVLAGFSIAPGIVDSTADIRFVFNGWTGLGSGSYTGSANPGECTMNGPITETANWRIQYYLRVTSDWGAVSGQGWYNAGVIANFGVTPDTVLETGTRHIFQRWDGTGDAAYSGPLNPASCTVNGPLNEQAIWTNQYYLTVYNGGYGTPSGEGWYDSGAIAVFSIWPETIPVTDSVRVLFSRWAGTGPGAYNGPDNPAGCYMNNPIREEAIWNTQYYLTILSEYGITYGEGWYSQGATAEFWIEPETVNVLDSRFVFGQWSGFGDESYSGPINPGQCVLNEPVTEEALWSEEVFLDLDYSGCGAAVPDQWGEGWYPLGSLVDIYTAHVIYDGGTRYSFDHWSGAVFTDPADWHTTLTVDSTILVIAHYAAFEVSTPDTFWGYPGDTVNIPIILYDDSIFSLDSLGLDFYYDDSLLHYVGILESAIAWDSLFAWEPPTMSSDSRIRVRAYSATPVITSPPETLFFFRMEVDTGASGYCPLLLRNLSHDLVSAQTVDGIFITNTNVEVVVQNQFGGDSVYVDGIKYASPYTVIWAPGTPHEISVDQVIPEDAGVRYDFTVWSDGRIRTHIVTALNDTTFTAYFDRQYLFGVFNPDGGDTPVPPVGSHWYDEGFNVHAYVTSPDDLNHLYCAGYNGTGDLAPGGTGSDVEFVITQPTVLEWIWQQQLYLVVVSEYGTPDPPRDTTWYNPGEEVAAMVDSIVVFGSDIRHICTGWSGAGSVPVSGVGTLVIFVINDNSSLEWQWDEQFYLNLAYSGTGGTPVAQTGEGWYDRAEWVDIETPGSVSSGDGVSYFFNYWRSNPPGATFSDSSLTVCQVFLDTPYVAIAVYQQGVRVAVIKEPREAYGSILVDSLDYPGADSILVW
ncbi:hypothetical protein JW877_00420, partial [bacterium]|nr:hypothetical protein [bacterium]